MMKQFWFVLTIIACFEWEAEMAEISTCPAASLSVTASPKKYYCDKTPAYKVVTNGAVSTTNPTKDETTETLSITLDQHLKLDSVTQCGITATAPVTCTALDLTLGSRDTLDDGSAIEIGSNKFDGLAKWSCSDTANPVPNDFHYYFFVNVGLKNTDTTADETVGQVNKIFIQSTVDNSKLNPMIFQHFDKVSKSTSIYFFKESDTKAHIVFYSTDTLINFDTAQYGRFFSTGPAGISQQVAAKCENAVLFCFDEKEKDCEKSEKSVASTPLAGIIAMLAPLFFAHF